LVFLFAKVPVASRCPGYPEFTLRPIVGIQYVEEAVAALGSSTELATHLFRECWVVGTGSDTDLCRVFGWEVEAHAFKVRQSSRVSGTLRQIEGLEFV
jgi:hypothetical protein